MAYEYIIINTNTAETKCPSTEGTRLIAYKTLNDHSNDILVLQVFNFLEYYQGHNFKESS